jgi:hypothetical protein
MNSEIQQQKLSPRDRFSFNRRTKHLRRQPPFGLPLSEAHVVASRNPQEGPAERRLASKVA